MTVATKKLSVLFLLLIFGLLPYGSLSYLNTELNYLKPPFAQTRTEESGKSNFYDYGVSYMNEARSQSNMSRSRDRRDRESVETYDMSNINNYKLNEAFERRRRHREEHVDALSPIEGKSEAVIETEDEHGGESKADETLAELDATQEVKLRQQREAIDLEVDVNMKKAFVGSNLFTSYRRSCFAPDDIALLQTRRDFELIIPKAFPNTLLSDHKVCLIMKYFNRISLVVSGITENESQFDSMRAFYDTLGGYLRHTLLPIARLSFYAGRLRPCTVDRLTQMYQECRESLNTKGNGWLKPARDLFDRLPRGEVLPLTTTYKTTEPGACTLLDLHSIDRDATNMQMLVALPHLDDEGDNDYLMNIALPFKRRRIYNLRSVNSAFILVRFFLIVTRCYETTGMCQDTYNNRFKEWINNNLELHMTDEIFYPGLGGILRVYENLRRTKKSIGNSSITSRFMNLASGGLGDKDFVVDDVGESLEKERSASAASAESEDDEAELEGGDDSKEITTADDADDDAYDNDSEDDDELENEDDDENEYMHNRKFKRERKFIKGMENTEQHRCAASGAQQGSGDGEDKSDNNRDKTQDPKPSKEEQQESKDEDITKNVSSYVPYMCVMVVVLLVLLFIITLCNVYRKSTMAAPRVGGVNSYDCDPSCSCPSATSSDTGGRRSQRSVESPAPASQTTSARTTPRQRNPQRQRSQTDSQDCCQKCFSSGQRKKTASSSKTSRYTKNCDEVIELQPNSGSVQPNSKSGGSNAKSTIKSSSSKRTRSRGASTAKSTNSDKRRTRRVHYLQQNLLAADETHPPDIDVERQLNIDEDGSSDSLYEKPRLHYPPTRQISMYSRLINEGPLLEENLSDQREPSDYSNCSHSHGQLLEEKLSDQCGHSDNSSSSHAHGQLFENDLSDQCAHSDDTNSSERRDCLQRFELNLNMSLENFSRAGSESSNDVPLIDDLYDDLGVQTA